MVSPGLIEDQEDEELKQHQPSPDVSISPDNFDNRIVKITAICSAGCETILSDNREDSRQHLLADPSDAMDYNVEMTSNSSKITAVLFVGISVDERFSCGEVILLDLNSDGRIASDIALCTSEGRSELDQIVVLTSKGRILCFDVKLPFLLLLVMRETKLSSLISNAHKAASSKSPIGEFQLQNELTEASSSSLDGMLAADDKTFSSFDSLDIYGR
uniref:Uncharacterized protein n=2 Tax=Meloidogyne TaxID=189290 RepID=A0A6V7XD12_MELEN|nr:unnamed protein product [Meloidogyne enterolobii]